jgi:ABC-type Zn2+ transport system substrate-binding protein/surface adhesin
MKSMGFAIYDYCQYHKISPQEIEKVIGNKMSWRVSNYLHEFSPDSKKLNLEKSWNDEQNYFHLNNKHVVRHYMFSIGTPKENLSFSYILILPNKENDELDFILLESSLDGHYWAEPRENKVMTANDLLKLNQKDRKKRKEIYYATPNFGAGIINKDKDFKKLLEKMNCDEFLVML